MRKWKVLFFAAGLALALSVAARAQQGGGERETPQDGSRTEAQQAEATKQKWLKQQRERLEEAGLHSEEIEVILRDLARQYEEALQRRRESEDAERNGGSLRDRLLERFAGLLDEFERDLQVEGIDTERLREDLETVVEMAGKVWRTLQKIDLERILAHLRTELELQGLDEEAIRKRLEELRVVIEDSLGITDARRKAALARTRVELHVVEKALDSYWLDHARLPRTGNVNLVRALCSRLAPTSYLRLAPERLDEAGQYLDHWGHPYVYIHLSDNPPAYRLYSLGPDGIDGTGDELGRTE